MIKNTGRKIHINIKSPWHKVFTRAIFISPFIHLHETISLGACPVKSWAANYCCRLKYVVPPKREGGRNFRPIEFSLCLVRGLRLYSDPQLLVSWLALSRGTVEWWLSQDEFVHRADIGELGSLLAACSKLQRCNFWYQILLTITKDKMTLLSWMSPRVPSSNHY